MRIAFVLALAGCGDPDTTACVALCQNFTAEPALCQTMCTRSCDELRRSFGIAEDTCRQMQQSPRASETPMPADQRRATSDSTH